MEGDGSVIAGVVKSKDDLIIIDEHRIQEGLDQPLLAVDIRVIHSCKLMQEENDMLFLQTQIFFQLGCGKCHSEILFLLLQFIHTLLGAFVENTCFNGADEVIDSTVCFIQSFLQGLGIGGVRSRNCIYDCSSINIEEPESLDNWDIGVVRPNSLMTFFDLDTC